MSLPSSCGAAMLRAVLIVAMMAAVVAAADEKKAAGHPMDDPLWLAAHEYDANKGGDRRSLLITPPAPPSLPPKVSG